MREVPLNTTKQGLALFVKLALSPYKILLRSNMKLPNGACAVVDIEKLRGYCLSAQHPEGRHKDRVFLATLGMSATDADKLREILLSAAAENDDVSMTSADEYGRRYII